MASARALASMLIYIVMALILAFRPQRPVRGAVREAHEPRNPRQPLLALLLLAAAARRLRSASPSTSRSPRASPILALAAVGLNIALGFGGLVSFGHAAFFGLGGYAAGILASHAFNGRAAELAVGILGTTSMPVIWLVGDRWSAALVALPIGAVSLRTTGVYFIMITLAFAQMIYLFRHLLAGLWRRGRAVDLAAQQLSRRRTRPSPCASS